MEKLEELLDGYKVGELKELAKTAGISGYSKLKKAELVDILLKQLSSIDINTVELPSEVKEALLSNTSNVEAAPVAAMEEEVVGPVAVAANKGLRKETIINKTILKSKKTYKFNKI